MYLMFLLNMKLNINLVSVWLSLGIYLLVLSELLQEKAAASVAFIKL